MKICGFFMAKSRVAATITVNEHYSTKLIENDNIELMRFENDINGSMLSEKKTQSEVFNNSENLMIVQRNTADKLFKIIEMWTAELV